ncbi:MAG TPA: hypothetical protein VKY39_03625 [Aggregatilineales bacterium]|nr:hypothetical protein [Aggregatilineales bacterium]
MDKKSVVLAIYDSLATGRNAVDGLLNAGFRREDIGLAAKQGVGEGSLVTVTVSENERAQAEEALNQFSPQTLTLRDTQWLAGGAPDEIPDVADYTAVDLTE